VSDPLIIDFKTKFAEKYIKSASFNVNQQVFSDFFKPEYVAKIPLISKIPAGTPLEVIDNVEAWVSVPESLIHDGDYFYLRVQDNNLNNSRICKGDIVLVRCQHNVEDGMIAVVRIDGQDGVLKHIKNKGEGLFLLSDDHLAEPMIIEKDRITIIGKVVRVEFEPKRK
jgi:repressor LexA